MPLIRSANQAAIGIRFLLRMVGAGGVGISDWRPVGLLLTTHLPSCHCRNFRQPCEGSWPERFLPKVQTDSDLEPGNTISDRAKSEFPTWRYQSSINYRITEYESFAYKATFIPFLHRSTALSNSLGGPD